MLGNVQALNLGAGYKGRSLCELFELSIMIGTLYIGIFFFNIKFPLEKKSMIPHGENLLQLEFLFNITSPPLFF